MKNINIVSRTQLTMSGIENIPEDIAAEMYLLEDVVDQEYLDDQDFVFLELICDGEKYIMIHGFPGDNANGVIYSGDEVVAWVGEGCNENNSFEKWYVDLTDYSTYCSEFFVPKKKSVDKKPDKAIQPSLSLNLLLPYFETEINIRTHEEQASQECTNEPEQTFIYDMSSHLSSRP